MYVQDLQAGSFGSYNQLIQHEIWYLMCNLSWKCPGYVLKSQGQNWMASHIFADFAWSCVCSMSSESVTCPLFHLDQEKLMNQLHLQNSHSKVQFYSFVEEIVSKSMFAIATTVLIPKYKNEVSMKDLLCKDQKMHCKAFLFLLPPCVSLILLKNPFFLFSFFVIN